MIRVDRISLVLVALLVFRAENLDAFLPPKSKWGPARPVTNEYHCRSDTMILSASTLSRSDVVRESNIKNVVENELSIEETTNRILSMNNEVNSNNHDKFNNIFDNILPILHSWSKRESIEGARMVQKILEYVEEQVDKGQLNSNKLHVGHYTIAIDAWAKSGHPHSGQKANEIVHKMEQRNIRLNRVTYNSWMNAYALQGNAKKTEEIFQRMQEDIPEEILIYDHNIVISAYSREGRAMEAEKILKELVDRCGKGEDTCFPSLLSYNLVLDGWAKSNDERCGERAEMILDAIEEQKELNLRPDLYSYVAAISALIHSGESNILDRVEAIWTRAKAKGNIEDCFLFSATLDAYARISPDNSLQRVEELLQEFDAIDSDREGKIVVYNSALKVFMESTNADSITLSEKLFEKMKFQNTFDDISYGTMITMYAKQKDFKMAQKRVKSLLDEIPEMGMTINTILLHCAMTMWINQGNIGKAEQILDDMEDAYHNGRLEIAPNSKSYTTIMNGWMKSRDDFKFEKTQNIFERMHRMFESGNRDAEPNVYTYSILLDSIVRSKQSGSAERAEKVVLDMYDRYIQGESTAKPNTQFVANVLNCWSKSGDREAGERAESLLKWLITKYEETKDRSFMPNEFPFSSAICAWAKSRKFGKAARARALLSQMLELYESGVIESPPNAHCYNAVINACAYSVKDSIEQRDALKIFVDTYKEMINDENVKANEVTFVSALTALRNLLPPGEQRVSAFSKIFKQCTDHGMVDENVIKKIKYSLPPDSFRELVGKDIVNEEGNIGFAGLPSEWTRNVDRIKGSSPTPTETRTLLP